MNPLRPISKMMRSVGGFFERRSQVLSDLIKLRGFRSFSQSTLSGQSVSEDTAIKVACVFASIKIISETIGSLPKVVYEIAGDGSKSVTTQHPVHALLNFEPHPWSTPIVWTETRFGQLLGWGNSYSEISRNSRSGEVTRLTTHHPSNVTPQLDLVTGDPLYQVRSQMDGVRTLDRSQMLHVPAFSQDGLVGLSPIRIFANAIGVAMAADRLVGLHFANKALPGITVTAKGSLGDKREAFIQHLRESVGGDNVFRPLVLEGDMKAEVHSIPLDEALLVTAREFQGKEIVCRCYRIPPHIAGYTDGDTKATVEQGNLAFEKHTLRPWLMREEQELNRKLFLPSERGRFVIKHDVSDLVRGDIRTRFEAYKTGILCGFLSRKEVRDWEDLDARPDDKKLDELMLPQAVFGKPGADPKDQQVSQTGAQPDSNAGGNENGN